MLRFGRIPLWMVGALLAAVLVAAGCGASPVPSADPPSAFPAGALVDSRTPTMPRRFLADRRAVPAGESR